MTTEVAVAASSSSALSSTLGASAASAGVLGVRSAGEVENDRLKLITEAQFQNELCKQGIQCAQLQQEERLVREDIESYQRQIATQQRRIAEQQQPSPNPRSKKPNPAQQFLAGKRKAAKRRATEELELEFERHTRTQPGSGGQTDSFPKAASAASAASAAAPPPTPAPAPEPVLPAKMHIEHVIRLSFQGPRACRVQTAVEALLNDMGYDVHPYNPYITASGECCAILLPEGYQAIQAVPRLTIAKEALQRVASLKALDSAHTPSSLALLS